MIYKNYTIPAQIFQCCPPSRAFAAPPVGLAQNDSAKPLSQSYVKVAAKPALVKTFWSMVAMFLELSR